MNYKKLLNLKILKLIIQAWIKKLKGLKKNGGLDKEYKVLNKVNCNKVLESAFDETNLCYLSLTFNKIDYTIETLIWRDEADYIKKIITFPSVYKISSRSVRTNHLDIKVYKVPEDIKRLYKTLDEQEFIEYIKRVLQGY